MFRQHRPLSALAAVAALGLAVAPSATADPIESSPVLVPLTAELHFDDVNPCTGEPGPVDLWFEGFVKAGGGAEVWQLDVTGTSFGYPGGGTEHVTVTPGETYIDRLNYIFVSESGEDRMSVHLRLTLDDSGVKADDLRLTCLG
jgi:hypothetical protein